MNKSFSFTHALCRLPAKSITNGLRANDVGDPDFNVFQQHHQQYVDTLRQLGCNVTVLDALQEYPDSVFIEDAALCIAGKAIALRPGDKTRFGEAAALFPSLQKIFSQVINLPGNGYVDGGDILVTENDVFIGLSSRTDETGFLALSDIISDLGYTPRKIQTPPDILHFKSDCGLLDNDTLFATKALAATGCFNNFNVIIAPENENAAANLIRVNDAILISDGYPKTKQVLEQAGYNVICLPNSEAEKVDGGLSCMSLRFAL